MAEKSDLNRLGSVAEYLTSTNCLMLNSTVTICTIASGRKLAMEQ